MVDFYFIGINQKTVPKNKINLWCDKEERNFFYIGYQQIRYTFI
jgi:hypothetical protein